MSHLLRIGGTLTTVLVAYGLYCLIAVPLIEPSFDSAKQARVSKDTIERAQAMSDRRLAELAEYFPAGAADLKNAKILQNDQVKLVIGDYTTEPDGRVRLTPCTIFYTPGDPDDPPEERRRRTVILHSPQGALLQFDQPFDLGQRKIGRLIGGELLGESTIQGEGRPNDPSDDLLIATRQVQLNEEHIWTPHKVIFRYGPHFGEGREMHIRMLPSRTADRSGGRGPRVGDIESFEMVHVDRLHLETPADGGLDVPSPNNTGLRASLPSPNGRNGRAAPKKTLPVEVSCSGPFRFDVPSKTATFRDRVAVVRIQPDGLNDRVSGDVLAIHFEPRVRAATPAGAGSAASPPNTTAAASPSATKKPAAPAEPPGPLDLQPRRVVAEGSPVIIQSPHEQLDARGGRLELDLADRRIELSGKTPVRLQQGLNWVESMSLAYQAHPDRRRTGRLVALGPGVLRGRTEKRPDETLEVRWNQELTLQPLEQDGVVYQVISLLGDASLDYQGIGRIDANRIYFYLDELPGVMPNDRWRLEPARMQADQNVRIRSAQMTFDPPLDLLQVWFRRQDTAGDPLLVAGGPGGANPSSLNSRDLVPGGGFVPAAAHPAMAGNMAGAMMGDKPANHFNIQAKQLLAEIALQGDRASVTKLTLNDGVRLLETQTQKPDEKPVFVQGDQISVHDASSPNGRMSVSGQPARFEGRGLGLTGGAIHLNRGTNRLWIDGPGLMDLPSLNRDLQGRPVRDTGPMQVRWQKRMEFDGRTTSFLGGVTAMSQDQTITTDTLEAVFQEPIRFSEVKADASNDRKLEELRCLGNVTIHSRTVEAGRLVSTENCQTRDVRVNLRTGELTAAGPGELTSRHYGSGGQAFLPDVSAAGQGGVQTPAASKRDSDEETLHYMHVAYAGRISGNVLRREIGFHDQVGVVYGPIDGWQSTLPDDNPDALGEEGLRVGCQNLSVAQMPSPTRGRPSVELSASGNTKIEGRDYTAHAARMTFDQAKGVLVLEGEPLNHATLDYQPRAGGAEQHTAFQKIQFWPKTQALNVSGAHAIDVSQFRLGKEPRP